MGHKYYRIITCTKKILKKNKEHKEQIKLAIYCNNLNEV